MMLGLGLAFFIALMQGASGDSGAVPSQYRLYAVEPADSIERLVSIDPQTGDIETALTLSGDTGFASHALAFNSSNELYGWDNDAGQLYQIDTDTGEVTHIGSPASIKELGDFTFDGNGNLYAMRDGTGDLVSVDTVTGATTIVGPIGTLDHSAVAYEYSTDKLYAIAGRSGSADNLYEIKLGDPLTYEDDFITDPTAAFVWEYGSACGSCTHDWYEAGDWIQIRTALTNGAGSYVRAHKSLDLPQSGYAKVQFTVVEFGPWQDRIHFRVKQDDNNYYHFTGSNHTWHDTVRKVVNGVAEEDQGGDSITTTGGYTMEMWWSPTNMKLAINGTVIKDMDTSDATVLKPTSLEFTTYRYHINWDSIEISRTSIAGVVGSLGVNNSWLGGEFSPLDGHFYTVRSLDKLMKVDPATGTNTPVATLGDGAEVIGLAAPWPEAAPPESTDADGDGVTDDVDNCKYTSNPGQEDGDGDGAGDTCDNCVSTSNPDQTDSNGDGAGDVCDLDPDCLGGTTLFNLNDVGTITSSDVTGYYTGVVSNPSATLPGDGNLHGDGVSANSIVFENCDECLQADTSMTLKTVFKPTGLEGTDQYIRRVINRTSGGNWQLSVWRNNGAFDGLYNAPEGTASLAFWTKVIDSHGGNVWKPVLTDYEAYPIVSDHYYYVTVVWNTDKPGGAPDEFFVPADIYIDDLGTDGNGAGENWPGLANATDSDQSLLNDIAKHYTGDQIYKNDGNFAIGANSGNENNRFNGTIDWISWSASAEQPCSGEKPPLKLFRNSSYWASKADYDSRILSVDFSIGNQGGENVDSMQIVGANNGNGVICTSTMPVNVGSIPALDSSDFTLTYSVPAGVSSFRTTLYGEATDICGNSFTYPGPYGEA